MTELTIEQALQKGIEAHKAGQLQEADGIYTAILKAQPKHPDANHNMGVLAVGVGKVQEALPFFKIALEANPSTAQFWLSYIDALIKLELLADAKAVFDQAKEKGAKGDGFDRLANQLLGVRENSSTVPKVYEPPPKKIDQLISLYNTGELQAVVNLGKELTEQYPHAISVWSFLGTALTQMGRLNEAIKALEKVTLLNPNFAAGHNNFGNLLKLQGKPTEAVKAYNKALTIKPDYAEARTNLAILLFESRLYKKAAELFILDSSTKNQSFLLKCFYELDEKEKFSKQLDYLIARGENNAVIGSYLSRSKVYLGIKKNNPFCNKPLNYVSEINLNKECDFKKIFVEKAANVLSNDEVKHKSQGHLTNGIQTAGNIFKQVGSVTDQWQNIIHAELKKYKDHFGGSDEGLIRNWPSDYSIYGWLVSMKSGGELSAHMHDTGWVTGSIYINVPPKSKKDSGNLVVTTDDTKREKGKTKNRKNIDIVTGSLVLFPSSLLHYTIPFEANEDRIVLAFDVIPK